VKEEEEGKSGVASEKEQRSKGKTSEKSVWRGETLLCSGL